MVDAAAMKKQDWSPEPWVYEHREHRIAIYACDGGGIGQVPTADGTNPDADRIIACVNAMAGISDPAALVESHAELLGLLKELVRFAPIVSADKKALIARAEAARK